MKLVFNDINDAHEWWLNGKRASGLSSLGKKIDNTWNLEQWGLRMTMLGTAMRPDLAEMALAHHDDKQTLGRLVEQAKNHAKANEGANRGTAKHRISERIDLGEEMLLSPAMAKFQADYLSALTAHALTVLPEYVERAVVWPDEKWCGRYDRIYGMGVPCPTCGGDKRIADLKGGDGAITYPHSIAIQLTGYAYAPHTAVMRQVGNVAKYEAASFDPHPDGLCRCKGIIVHAPEDGGVAVYEIDLVPEKLDLIRDVLAWQKRAAGTIVRPMTVAVESGRTPATGGEDGVEAVSAAVASPVDPFDDLVPSDGGAPALARRAEWKATMPDESELIDDPDTLLGHLAEAYGARPDNQRQLIDSLLAAADTAGVPFGAMKHFPTVRRFEATRVAFAIAKHMWSETESVARAAIAQVWGDRPEVHQAPLGALIGAMTTAELRQLHLAVEDYGDGKFEEDWSSFPMRLNRAA